MKIKIEWKWTDFKAKMDLMNHKYPQIIEFEGTQKEFDYLMDIGLMSKQGGVRYEINNINRTINKLRTLR